MGTGASAAQVFQLQTREIVRTYVRELAGWDKREAQDSFLAALELIESTKDNGELAERLLAAEPTDLDDLINGGLVAPGEVAESVE